MGYKCPEEYLLKENEVQIPLPHDPLVPRIVCSACKLSDGTIIPSIRHWDLYTSSIFKLLAKSQTFPGSLKQDVVQGFIDNKGKFLTREDAWIVAFKAGQIIRRCGNDNGKLWSENLY